MMERIPLGLNNPYTGIIGEADEVLSNLSRFNQTNSIMMEQRT